MSSIVHRKRIIPCSILVIVGLSFGCSSKPHQKLPRELDRVLTAATEIEFYSIDGRWLDDADRTPDELEGIEIFQGRGKVLGRTALTDEKTITKLVKAFRAGVNERDLMPASCFWPRHAIRVVHDGVTYDIVICFECSQYEWYTDDKRQGVELIGDSPQPTFNRILEDAGVTLAVPAFE